MEQILNGTNTKTNIKNQKEISIMIFILCYTDIAGQDHWEEIIGEDAMQLRVGELAEELNCSEDDIMVFDKETQW